MNQLYRHYNSSGELLYIGISISQLQRLAQHKQYSHWIMEVSDIKIENFETREEALKAERWAIKEECPKYNVIHNDMADSLQTYTPVTSIDGNIYCCQVDLAEISGAFLIVADTREDALNKISHQVTYKHTPFTCENILGVRSIGARKLRLDVTYLDQSELLQLEVPTDKRMYARLRNAKIRCRIVTIEDGKGNRLFTRSIKRKKALLNKT
jgi:predicted GIY-YIG superfamily endonuclease